MTWLKVHAAGLLVGCAMIACAEVTYITPRGLHVYDPWRAYEPEQWDRTLEAYERLRPAKVDTSRIFISVGPVEVCDELNEYAQCVRHRTYEAYYHRRTDLMRITPELSCGRFHALFGHELEHAWLDQEGRHPLKSHDPPFDRTIDRRVLSDLLHHCPDEDTIPR